MNIYNHISLPSKPDACPLCNKKFFHKGKDSGIDASICVNFQQCKMTLLETDSYKCFFLRKELEDGTAVWWCSEYACHLADRIKGGIIFTPIDFIPPYSIDVERLKTLMLFI